MLFGAGALWWSGVSVDGCSSLFPVRLRALCLSEWWRWSGGGRGHRGSWSLTNLASFPRVGWDQIKLAAPSVSICVVFTLCLRPSRSPPRPPYVRLPVFVSRSLFLSLPLHFVHPSDFYLHSLTSHLSLSPCLSPLLSISLCLFVLPSPSAPPHPAGQEGLWCEADIYSRGSFISTVSLFKQRAGSQINKMAERMDLLRVLFSLQR